MSLVLELVAIVIGVTANAVVVWIFLATKEKRKKRG